MPLRTVLSALPERTSPSIVTANQRSKFNMPSFIVELDPSVLEWVENVHSHLAALEDDYLLLEYAITELEDFRNENYPSSTPTPLRRSLALLKHLSSGNENDLDELTHLCDRILTHLEAAMNGTLPHE